MVLHTQIFGPADGRPLVALHGIRGHGGRWRRWSAEHLPEFRVYALDLRGHGYSSWEPPWHLERHVADVLSTMDDHGVERFDLIGHSYGGCIALHLAQAAPERLGRLVLLDPAIGIRPQDATAGARQNLVAPVFDSPAEARAARAKHVPATDDQGLDEEVADHLAEGGDGRWRWRYETAAVVVAFSEMARPTVLPPPGLPTLLVPAARVAVVWAEYQEQMRAHGVQVSTVDSGHQLVIERPAETAAVVRPFLLGR